MRAGAFRETKGSLIGEKQSIQHWIADSWIQIQQFRLQVLHTAWLIDNEGDYAKVRQHIAGVKVATPKVLIDVVYRAMHAHGSLRVSNLMPLTSMWMSGPVMGIADGPTEVTKTPSPSRPSRATSPPTACSPPCISPPE